MGYTKPDHEVHGTKSLSHKDILLVSLSLFLEMLNLISVYIFVAFNKQEKCFNTNYIMNQSSTDYVWSSDWRIK